MRLNEITKDEFVDKLKDPALAAIKKLFVQFRDEISKLGWTAELVTHTKDSVIVRCVRDEVSSGETVAQITGQAFRHFVDSNIDDSFGVVVVDQIQESDYYRMILGW